MRATIVFCFAAITAPPVLVSEEPPAASSAPVQFGGLFQVQGEGGDPGDSRFDGGDRVYLRRARLNATARFPEHITARLELELAGSLSKTSALRAQVTDGYIEWNRFSALSVRAGQFKTPFGFEQLFLDSRLSEIERSLANDRITAGRQLGVQLFGETGPVNYSAGFFNGTGTNNNFNDNGNFLYAGRLSVNAPRATTRIGEISGALGVDGLTSRDQSVPLSSDFHIDSTPSSAARDDVFSGRRHAVGVDGQLRAGGFELWAEYLSETFEPKDSIPFSRFRSDGWFGQATWFALPARLQFLARYETFDPDRRVRDVETRTWIAGVNYFVRGDSLKLQLDYLRTRIPSGKQQNKALARVQTVF
jgi:phosphate-selective porin